MNIHDMGVLNEPVFLFGGVYSNLQALLALDAIRGGATGICTGDLVAYCADPGAVVARIMASDTVVVAGNCEKQLAANAEDCGCGFEAGTTCSVLSVQWYEFARRRLDGTARTFFASCPDLVVFSQSEKRFAVIHGGVSDVARFLWSVSPDAAFEEEIKSIEDHVGPVDGVIAGHSGIGFQRQIGDVAWINAGVIGMPPNDGGTETEYLVLTGGVPRFHRLAYDHRAASAAMVAAGLTGGYETALLSGSWPSEDVLPRQMRRSAV